MKFFILMFIFISTACSSKKPAPPSLSMAFDASQENQVEATAVKRKEASGVCFDVSLKLKNSDIELPPQWTVAWVDEEQRYHLITPTLREPAHSTMWRNHFTACERNVKFHQVKALILSPKENDAFKEKLQLRW